MTKKIQKTGLPFITTSVNLSGEKPSVKLSEIPKTIKKQVDVIIQGRKLSGKPSTLIINNKKIKR